MSAMVAERVGVGSGLEKAVNLAPYTFLRIDSLFFNSIHQTFLLFVSRAYYTNECPYVR